MRVHSDTGHSCVDPLVFLPAGVSPLSLGSQTQSTRASLACLSLTFSQGQRLSPALPERSRGAEAVPRPKCWPLPGEARDLTDQIIECWVSGCRLAAISSSQSRSRSRRVNERASRSQGNRIIKQRHSHPQHSSPTFTLLLTSPRESRGYAAGAYENACTLQPWLCE